MPKMGVNPEQTKAEKPVPAGWYKLRLTGATVKLSKSGKGHNYEFYTKVTENTAEYNDKFISVRANNGFNQAKVTNDIVHGFGFPLETDGSIPGDWVLKDGIIEKEGKYFDKEGKELEAAKAFDGAQYKGPLLGKVLEAELAVGSWEGQERNEVKQVRCKLSDCRTKFPDIQHLTDIRGKK